MDNKIYFIQFGQVIKNLFLSSCRSNQFIIRMSRDTLSILKRHLQEKKHSVLLNIIQEHLYFDMYEGVARNKQQIDATSGAMVGEATRQGNNIPLYISEKKDILYSLHFVEESSLCEVYYVQITKPRSIMDL